MPGSVRPVGRRRYAIRALNQFRRSKGLDPLHWDRSLNPYTRQHSQAMAGEGGIFHSTGEQLAGALNQAVGQGAWSLAGENVGMVGNPDTRPRDLIDGLFKAFRQSKDHRRNMLRSRYDDIGVGMARGEDGNFYLTYWFYDDDPR